MSIWDEALTKEEYVRRLFALKAEQRRRDAALPFEEKVEIVITLQEASRALCAALADEPPPVLPSARARRSCR